MPRVLHVVTTSGFAGVERYVCDVAKVSAAHGWDVCVVGGDRERMLVALDGAAEWEEGARVIPALRALKRLGRFDVCNAHMTAAETVAVIAKPLHRAAIVATRHFAARRGASPAGRAAAPLIASQLAGEIALGEFIAEHMERPPHATIISGVRPSPCLWRSASRSVVMMQRFEPEKDTLTGLRAWQASRLAEEGWKLRLHGDGSQRGALERWAADQGAAAGIEFAGWSDDVPGALSQAGIMLATALAEPLGLAVLDAMAAGVPLVAAAGGGHLETAGCVEGAPLFPPGDAEAAAVALRELLDDERRARLSGAGRDLVSERFTIDRHVQRLLAEYDSLRSTTTSRARSTVTGGSA